MHRRWEPLLKRNEGEPLPTFNGYLYIMYLHNRRSGLRTEAALEERYDFYRAPQQQRTKDDGTTRKGRQIR